MNNEWLEPPLQLRHIAVFELEFEILHQAQGPSQYKMLQRVGGGGGGVLGTAPTHPKRVKKGA